MKANDIVLIISCIGLFGLMSNIVTKMRAARRLKMIIDPIDTKIKPFWIRWLCLHNFTGGVRVVFDNKGRKRYARICLKCGKRDYIN